MGGLELAYDELGDPDGEPMLMVMGLGAQLIHWDRRFCEMLGERGFRVIRFDNRDVGHSSKTEGAAAEDDGDAAGASIAGWPTRSTTWPTMRRGSSTQLGIESAHLVGASMGGMIAQVVGYRRPRKARSLALIMTGSGKRVASLPRMRAFGTLMARPGPSREHFVEFMVKTFGVIGSPEHPDPDREAGLREACRGDAGTVAHLRPGRRGAPTR